jgi:hypothetical protein
MQNLAVVMEIALLDAALVECDAVVESCGQGEQRPTLNLRWDGIRVDHDAAIDRGGRPAQTDLAVGVDFHFEDERSTATKAVVHSDTASVARGERGPPAGSPGGLLPDAARSRVHSQQGAAMIERVPLGRMGEFVEETRRRNIMRLADASPPVECYRPSDVPSLIAWPNGVGKHGGTRDQI